VSFQISVSFSKSAALVLVEPGFSARMRYFPFSKLNPSNREGGRGTRGPRKNQPLKTERATAAAIDSVLASMVSERLVRTTGAEAPRIRPAVLFSEK